MNEATRLNELLDKYRFTEPVPDAVRKSMIKSRKRVLIACLKKVNNYSIFFGAALFFYFLAKKIKLDISLSAGKFLAVSVNAVSAGLITGSVYTAVNHKLFENIFINSPDVQIKKEDKSETPQDKNDQAQDKQIIAPSSGNQTDAAGIQVEILLYNGKIYRGVILSRGCSYILQTPQGTVSIPSTQVRNIRKIQ